MNIIFMRHGEATDNVKNIISDKEIYWSVLTKKGIKKVKKSIKELPLKIDKLYVSPFPRTIQTASYIYSKYPSLNVVIEDRIRETLYGKYSGCKNNEDIDNVRIKQIEGDYFIRFGESGENKYEIELRLSSFLKDLYNDNKKDSTIVIVSHGSIISYMKRILNLKLHHTKKGEIEMFNNVDFNYLFNYMNKLKIVEKEMNLNE